MKEIGLAKFMHEVHGITVASATSRKKPDVEEKRLTAYDTKVDLLKLRTSWLNYGTRKETERKWLKPIRVSVFCYYGKIWETCCDNFHWSSRR